MSTRLTIINRSRWPDWFVRPVCEWIVSRAGITSAYKITLPDSRIEGRAGRGGRLGQRSRIPRRIQPTVREEYGRYKGFPSMDLESRLERFVHLIAHEARHANQRKVSPRVNELDAEMFAFATVKAFRMEWPSMKPAMVKRLRAARQRDRNRQAAAAERRATAATTESKVAAVEARIAEWERKKARCESWIGRYRRRLRALRAAQTRKMAANQQQEPI